MMSAIVMSAVIVVTNIGFTVGYDTETKNPAWVSYELEPCEVVGTSRKSYQFAADPRIEGTDRADDYKTTPVKFDRGHLAPAADFNWDTNALRQTYYFTNVCPMTPRLNRGDWKKAEDAVRELARSGTVHVVTFPQYQGWYENGGRMRLPTSFVKVAYGWFGVKIWELKNEE